jgi:hypothetical protein
MHMGTTTVRARIMTSRVWTSEFRILTSLIIANVFSENSQLR